MWGTRTHTLLGVGLTGVLVVGGVIATEKVTPEPPNEVVRVPPPTTLPAPTRRTDTHPAMASVDEHSSLYIHLTGVPLRDAPRLGAEKTGMVNHTDRLNIHCWTIGEELTNGWRDRTYDDATEYRSDVWWYVTDLGQEGYISDVWLGRTDGDRLGVERCP